MAMSALADPPERTVAGAQAIHRAAEVMRAVALLQRKGAHLGDVAELTGLRTSTAFRILRTLAAERILVFDEPERTYHLGPLAYELGLASRGRNSVLGRWRPVVERIAARTRLTSHLFIRSDSDAVCLASIEGTLPIRTMPVEAGERFPMGIGAGSLAILATDADDGAAAMLARNDRRLRGFACGEESPARAAGALAEARRNGFSVSPGLVDRGIVGIGVAIPTDDPLMQLSISVSAVEGSIDPAGIREIARIISAEIAAAGNRVPARQEMTGG